MVLSFLDILKVFYGQEIFRTIMDIFFYFFFLLLTGLKSNKLVNNGKFQLQFTFKNDIFFFILLILVLIEVVSWIFMKAAFNTQALNAIELSYFTNESKAFFPYIYLLFLCHSTKNLFTYQKLHF